MPVTSIRLNPDVEAPLAELSEKLDRSRNYLINQAIKEYISRQAMEDLRWRDTLGALDSVKAGRLVEGTEVADWLESWGGKKEKKPPRA